MEILLSIFYGFVQGITEFLPISSSGHNIVLAKALKYDPPTFSLDIITHLGSLIALGYFFFKSSKDKFIDFPNKSLMILLICFSWIPIGVVGILFKEFFENSARHLNIIGPAFILSGVFITLHGIKKFRMNPFIIVLLISFAQSFAAFPGISRSGVTIGFALLFGLGVRRAILCSFLMSVPLIILSSIFEVVSSMSSGIIIENWKVLLVSLVSSVFFSYLGLKFMLSFSRFTKFAWFGAYNLLIGLIILLSLVL